jgi:hypothetical protein
LDCVAGWRAAAALAVAAQLKRDPKMLHMALYDFLWKVSGSSREGGPGGLTREVETPLPSNHPECDQVAP